MMHVKILQEADITQYEQFVSASFLHTITQSTVWGHFQQTLPERGKTWRLAVFKEENLIAACLVVKHALPKGYCWLYSQGGPIGDYEGSREWLPVLVDALKKIAKQENAVYWRIAPQLPIEISGKNIGFKKAHASYQPESTLVLDLNKSEDELLREMKPKGRYNIKVAHKHDVLVRFSDGSHGDLEYFYKLLKKTADRSGFYVHPFEYYLKFLKTLYPTGNAVLAVAEHAGTIISGALLTLYGETATYYYGASSHDPETRKYMAPYLLQWEMIRYAQQRGYAFYDFLGIAPEGVDNHPWSHVTDFKLKFGGMRKNYHYPQEYIFKPAVFHSMRLAKGIRRLMRR